MSSELNWKPSLLPVLNFASEIVWWICPTPAKPTIVLIQNKSQSIPARQARVNVHKSGMPSNPFQLGQFNRCRARPAPHRDVRMDWSHGGCLHSRKAHQESGGIWKLQPGRQYQAQGVMGPNLSNQTLSPACRGLEDTPCEQSFIAVFPPKIKSITTVSPHRKNSAKNIARIMVGTLTGYSLKKGHQQKQRIDLQSRKWWNIAATTRAKSSSS